MMIQRDVLEAKKWCKKHMATRYSQKEQLPILDATPDHHDPNCVFFQTKHVCDEKCWVRGLRESDVGGGRVFEVRGIGSRESGARRLEDAR